jgi:beta-N-acetylhexosaminidase|tara:strand:- start:1929 stop:2945 length:1017 start_codon:yes stop_codon:yes gene_type:complete
MGPIMLDVQGTSLTNEDKDLLEHPLVGGLILFTRNYESPQQITSLTQEIRHYSGDEILIAVDHEGGRVQRFREQFCKIPAMGKLTHYANYNIDKAKVLAKHCGVLMAFEVQAVGIDISFAPVLDVNGISDVIGDRAFHSQPEQVSQIAEAFIEGMNIAGMKATGKHFPGHGSVKEDSHLALPIDIRSATEISNFDLIPFKELIAKKSLAALMPAHIIFPEIDKQAVGFSALWLQKILRQDLNFDGVIFSDDLSMEGAASIGGYIERAEAAQQAGCDMLLTCNDRTSTIEVIDKANIEINNKSKYRLQQLLKTSQYTWQTRTENRLWQESHHFINSAIL